MKPMIWSLSEDIFFLFVHFLGACCSAWASQVANFLKSWGILSSIPGLAGITQSIKLPWPSKSSHTPWVSQDAVYQLQTLVLNSCESLSPLHFNSTKVRPTMGLQISPLTLASDRRAHICTHTCTYICTHTHLGICQPSLEKKSEK